MISELLRSRQKTFLKQSLKYLRLIFNDHFTIVLIFLLGAGGFFYRNLLAQVSPEMIWLKLLLTMFLTGLILVGQPASHLTEADALYILPKLTGFKRQYFKFSKQLFFIKVVILGIIFAALYPLFKALTDFTPGLSLVFFALIITWQALRIIGQVFERIGGQDQSSLLVATLIFLSLSLAVQGNWLFSILFVIFFSIATGIKLKRARLWPVHYSLLKLIQDEKIRKQRIYRFFAMVRDVPQVESEPVRNNLLNHMIKAIFPDHNNRINYLMPRLVFRQATYFNLIIRLILVGSILIYFSNHIYLSVLFALLFHWLILYQLLPLAKDLKDRPSSQLHQIKEESLIKGLQKFLLRLSVIILFIFTLVGAIANKNNIFILLVGEFMFIIVFVYLYLPQKVRRLI